jgi:predicted membrane-bound mannosyltransferase
VVLVAAGAWVASVVIGWAVAPSLGHDEAQYALSAKDLLAGAEPRWFYVSRGMSYFAAPGVLAGGSDLAMRFVPLVTSLGFAAAAWLCARALCGRVTAAWALAVLAASTYHVEQSSELLSDLPAAALLLAAMAILAGELGRERIRWRVVWIAPLFAGAFYIRYASCIPIAFACAAWVVLGGRAMLRRPWPLVVAAALFVVLWLPHLLEAQRTTGSPFGILLDSRGPASRGRGPDEPWFPYFATNPFRSYGLALAPVLAAGLFAWLPRSARGDRRLWLASFTALASIVVLGWVGVMQPRYVVFPVTLLAILGVDLVRRLVATRPPRQQTVIAAIAVAALVIATGYATSVQAKRGARRARSMSRELAAAQAIRADRTPGVGCVVATDSYTQLEWYTGCAAEGFASYQPFDRGEALYVVHMDDERTARPRGPGERHDTILVVPGRVTVTRVTRAPTAP